MQCSSRHPVILLLMLYFENRELLGDVFASDELFDYVEVQNTKLIKRHMQ